MDNGLDDVVGELPPSCKLVVYVMADRDEWVRASEIAQWAWLSERTVYDALGRLEECGLVDRKKTLEDRRGYVYRLNTLGSVG